MVGAFRYEILLRLILIFPGKGGTGRKSPPGTPKPRKWGEVIDMENGIYLACPRCLELSKGDGWEQEVKEIYTENIRGIDITKTGEVRLITKKEPGEKFIESISHRCGFYSEVYGIDEFIIRIEDGTITEAGNYFIEFPDELKKVAKKHGLKIALRGVKE